MVSFDCSFSSFLILREGLFFIYYVESRCNVPTPLTCRQISWEWEPISRFLFRCILTTNLIVSNCSTEKGRDAKLSHVDLHSAKCHITYSIEYFPLSFCGHFVVFYLKNEKESSKKKKFNSRDLLSQGCHVDNRELQTPFPY